MAGWSPDCGKVTMASILDVGTSFDSEERLAGLSDSEAASRIARYGFNELPSSKPRSILGIALEVVREPMLLLLLACGSHVSVARRR